MYCFCRFLETRIDEFQILHVPRKKAQIEVTGPDVEGLEAELQEIAERLGYSLTCKNLTILETDDEPLLSRWTTLFCGNDRAGKLAVACSSSNERKSVVDKIALGKDRKRGSQQKDKYGLTVAHSFLSASERKEFEVASDRNFDELFKRITENRSKNENTYFVLTPTDAVLDIMDTPLPQYQYWVQTDSQQPLLDLAVFKLDSSQLNTHRQNIQFSRTFDVLPIRNESDVIEQHGARIVCAGKYGMIWEQPRICRAPCFRSGLHFVFDLDDEERLVM